MKYAFQTRSMDIGEKVRGLKNRGEKYFIHVKYFYENWEHGFKQGRNKKFENKGKNTSYICEVFL